MGRYKSNQPPTEGNSFPQTYQPQGFPQQQGLPPRPQGMPQMGQQSQYNPQDWPTSFPKAMIGIDRDGVIIEWKNVIKKYEDVRFINGSLDAIRKLRLKGHKMMMFSDQPNIIKGLLTDQDVSNVNNHIMQTFGQSGIFSIEGFLYNQSDDSRDHYAKPNIGMLSRSKNEMGLDWTDGYYVGDTIEDVKMAIKFGVTPVLVRTGKGKQTEKDHFKGISNKYEGVKVFDNLLSFVDSLD